VEVGQIWKSIRDAQERSLALQAQQKMFNLPVSSYETLMSLSKELQPYRDLWVTASGKCPRTIVRLFYPQTLLSMFNLPYLSSIHGWRPFREILAFLEKSWNFSRFRERH